MQTRQRASMFSCDEAIGPRDAVKLLGGDGTVVPPARFIALANDSLAGRTLNARHLTCAECSHFERCKWLLSRQGDETECDWSPSRFN
jgi:hypothetical protein